MTPHEIDQALEQVQEVLEGVGKAGIASYLQGIRSHVAQLAATAFPITDQLLTDARRMVEADTEIILRQNARIAELKAQLAASAVTKDARLAELEARHATDDDLWHIAGIVAELSGGNLFNVSQHECVTAIRASFMDPDSGRAYLAAALKKPVPAPQGEGA